MVLRAGADLEHGEALLHGEDADLCKNRPVSREKSREICDLHTDARRLRRAKRRHLRRSRRCARRAHRAAASSRRPRSVGRAGPPVPRGAPRGRAWRAREEGWTLALVIGRGQPLRPCRRLPAAQISIAAPSGLFCPSGIPRGQQRPVAAEWHPGALVGAIRCESSRFLGPGGRERRRRSPRETPTG